MESWAAILISACVGALVSFIVSFWVANGNRRHAYYDRLISSISDHNWNLTSNKLKAGLPITNIPQEVSIVCYQHLNLFFLVWLNRSYAKRDGSMQGWKRWSQAIINGAKLSENKDYRTCYRQILSHGDLYPTKFIHWLSEEIGLSISEFHEVDN